MRSARRPVGHSEGHFMQTWSSGAGKREEERVEEGDEQRHSERRSCGQTWNTELGRHVIY